MTITEIVGQELSIDDTIKYLQNRRLAPQPDIENIKKEYLVTGHEVFDKTKRPDKIIKPDENTTKTELVARIGLSLQSVIVERAVSFLFGNNVKLVSEDNNSPMMTAISQVNKQNKIDAFNRRIARNLFISTEIAEYWYAVDTTANDKYGFNASKKIRCSMFSPYKDDLLYPYFDAYGDLIAFSRSYKVTDADGKAIEMFETWTDSEYKQYARTDGWQEVTESSRTYSTGKIPIIYAQQDTTEWSKVQSLIDRLEKLISNFSDTNDYFASPLLFVNGVIDKFSSKGEQGKIIQAENGDTTAQYLAWSQLPEPIKLEADFLIENTFSISQTPNISFERMQGLGQGLSGAALSKMFIDAHLKVMNKQEIFDSYLSRRHNVVKSLLKELNGSLDDSIDIDTVITPFMSDIDSSTIGNLVSAFQGGILSLETAVQNNPYVSDSASEIGLIKNEEVNKTQSGV